MTRLSNVFGSALIVFLGIAATAAADGPSAPAMSHAGFRGHRVRFFEHCLSTVGLSSDQQTAIQAIQADARTAMQADFAALRTTREKLKADLANGADKSVLGQDTLDQDAASNKLKEDGKSAHEKIVAQLHPDQQSALDSCLQSRRGKGDSLTNDQSESQ